MGSGGPYPARWRITVGCFLVSFLQIQKLCGPLKKPKRLPGAEVGKSAAEESLRRKGFLCLASSFRATIAVNWCDGAETGQSSRPGWMQHAARPVANFQDDSARACTDALYFITDMEDPRAEEREPDCRRR